MSPAEHQPTPSKVLRSFGVIALLAMIGYLGIGLIAPLIERPRHRGPTPCRKNLRRIALAFLDYHERYSSLPPAYIAGGDGRPMHSWRVLILPFLDRQDLYDQYRFDEPWNGPHNRGLASKIGEAFHCPLDPGPATDTSYVVVVGKKTAFPGAKPVRLSDITDGMSNTILAVEMAESGIHWMEPRDLMFDEAVRGVNPPGERGISSRHTASAQIALVDGTCRYVTSEVNPELRNLLEINDGHEIHFP